MTTTKTSSPFHSHSLDPSICWYFFVGRVCLVRGSGMSASVCTNSSCIRPKKNTRPSRECLQISFSNHASPHARFWCFLFFFFVCVCSQVCRVPESLTLAGTRSTYSLPMGPTKLCTTSRCHGQSPGPSVQHLRSIFASALRSIQDLDREQDGAQEPECKHVRTATYVQMTLL